MKKKILFIIEGLKSGGGAERVVASLTKNISTQFNVHILTIKDFKNKYPYGGKYYSLQKNFGSDSKVLKFLRLYNIQYLINPGSVGQPRDGSAKASFLEFDSTNMQCSFYKVDYPVSETQQKIISARLPVFLASRLILGR